MSTSSLLNAASSNPASSHPPLQKRKRESTTAHESTVAAQEDEVVPFIECCSDGTYAVHDEAIEFLRNLNGPIGVVSIVGPYRTGKSTLLNRCLLQRQSLKIGSTVNACTKGILLVKHVLKGPSILENNTKSLPVIVLDTEGLGSIDATNTHDVRIFSMALLLSSLFMYNSVGSIDENALTNLSLVASICKSLQLEGCNSGDEEGGGAAAEIDALTNAERLGKEAFPPLLWIVRDFALQLVNSHNQPITPLEYLEQTLQVQGEVGFGSISSSNNNNGGGGSGSSTSSSSMPFEQQQQSIGGGGGSGGSSSLASELMREKNNLRKYIKACFPLRQCITMVRPVSDESMLQSLSTSMRTPVRKIFEDQMQYVRQFVMHNIREKRIGGGSSGGTIAVTGPGLVKYAQAIVESINQGTHPIIRDTWSLITKSQFDDAVSSAKRIFTDMMRSSSSGGGNVTAGSRMEEMKAAERTALAFFRKQPLPTGREHTARTTELKEFFAKEKEFYEKLAGRMSESDLETAVNAMHNEVVNLIDAATAIDEKIQYDTTTVGVEEDSLVATNYANEMEILRSKVKAVRAAKAKCLDCYDTFAADLAADPACSRAASIATKHHRQIQMWVGALAASLNKMADLAVVSKLDLADVLAKQEQHRKDQEEEETQKHQQQQQQQLLMSCCDSSTGAGSDLETGIGGGGGNHHDDSTMMVVDVNHENQEKGTPTASFVLCEKLEAALADLSSAKAQLDDRDDQLTGMRQELETLRSELATERLKTTEIEDRLMATKGNMDETSRQREDHYKQRVKEVEQAVQIQYMKQLEELTATVDKKMADAEAALERKVQEAEQKVIKMEDACKRSDAVRDHVILTCSKLRLDLAHLNEVRLTERMEWATRLADMEKVVIASDAKRKRLEELYDPEMASKLHTLQVSNSQLATDVAIKSRELTRLQAELEEAKVARDKWNKLYYDDNCKHREEILHAKYNRPSLAAATAAAARGHARKDAYTASSAKKKDEEEEDVEELLALRKK